MSIKRPNKSVRKRQTIQKEKGQEEAKTSLTKRNLEVLINITEETGPQ